MKKTTMVVALVVLAVFCSSFYGWSQTVPSGPPGQVDVKAFRQFQKETLPLRDELMAKRLELRNEYAQGTPNLDRIAALQKEMIDLRTKIQTAAQKNGVATIGCGWGGGPGFGRGAYHGPRAGWGRGPGGGMGYHGMGYGGMGYGNVNCPMAN